MDLETEQTPNKPKRIDFFGLRKLSFFDDKVVMQPRTGLLLTVFLTLAVFSFSVFTLSIVHLAILSSLHLALSIIFLAAAVGLFGFAVYCLLNRICETIRLDKDGIHYQNGVFKKKKVTTAWNNINKAIYEKDLNADLGFIKIFPIENSKTYVAISETKELQEFVGQFYDIKQKTETLKKEGKVKEIKNYKAIAMQIAGFAIPAFLVYALAMLIISFM